jgi:hypothetical protein
MTPNEYRGGVAYPNEPDRTHHGWDLLQDIGGGGQARVYLARELSGQRREGVVKVMTPFTHADQRESFGHEGQLLNWEHPNIVTMYAHGYGRIAHTPCWYWNMPKGAPSVA